MINRPFTRFDQSAGTLLSRQQRDRSTRGTVQDSHTLSKSKQDTRTRLASADVGIRDLNVSQRATGRRKEAQIGVGATYAQPVYRVIESLERSTQWSDDRRTCIRPIH